MALKEKTNKEIRQECRDYMYAMSQLPWTPSEDIDLTSIVKTLVYKKGVTYYGVMYNTYFGEAHPYTMATLEYFKTFLDENGVYHGPIERQGAIGNHCTSAPIVAWKHIGDAITATYSGNTQPRSGTGVLTVGDYVYQDDDVLTIKIWERNGEEKMLECLAQAQMADCVIRSTFIRDNLYTGHTRMIDENIVVRDENGKIDADKSYITCLEQTWSFDKDASVPTTWYVHHKYTYTQLKDGWIPITCQMLKGTK